jgi:sugar-specific transcriptional regulator TrmB
MSKILQIYQDKINNLTTQINAMNTEIATLQGETSTDASIVSLFQTRIQNLQRKVSSMTTMRDNFQKIYDAETAAANAAFTSDQQTVVNTIDPKYNMQMTNLKRMSADDKTKFFTLYANATTDCQKTCVIRSFFNM